MIGAGGYLRSHHGRFGFELSLDGMVAGTDAVSIEELGFEGPPNSADLWVGMGSIMSYLNPNGVVRLYGTAGLGVDASADLGTFGIAGQVGAGADMNLGQRLVLNAEARLLVLDPMSESVVADSIPLVSFGIARRR